MCVCVFESWWVEISSYFRNNRYIAHIRFDAYDKADDRQGFGKYADGSWKKNCMFTCFSSSFPSLVSTLRAVFSSSLENNSELQMSSFTISVWRKKSTQWVYSVLHTLKSIWTQKLTLFFLPSKQRHDGARGIRKSLQCNYYVSEKKPHCKNTHTYNRVLSHSHGIDIVRAKADASECELKTTEMKKNIRLKTMRNARSAHMQIRAIRLNLPKVSIYQKPIVKMQTEAERERVEKRAHKMGENEAVQVMEQVSGFDSVYPKERSISMASAASPIHSWVNCSGIRTSNKSTHSNLLFVRFFLYSLLGLVWRISH